MVGCIRVVTKHVYFYKPDQVTEWWVVFELHLFLWMFIRMVTKRKRA